MRVEMLNDQVDKSGQLKLHLPRTWGLNYRLSIKNVVPDLPYITKFETFSITGVQAVSSLYFPNHLVSLVRKQVKNHSLNRMIQTVTY